jgi:tetratricopeptide (TPR) repeat protein
MLERAVGLDPTYAPAWANLGRRYYLDSQYGGGGEMMFQKANTALGRALALDPNLTLARAQRIANWTERGELAKAYQDAQNLVQRQPKNAMGHFILGYVLRYAGLLDEAARACEDALALDSGDYTFRVCSLTYSELGNPERAMDFIRLDAGSTWFNNNVVRLLWQEGKLAEAREVVQRLPSDSVYYTKFYKACVNRPDPRSPSAEMDRIVREQEPSLAANPDPEDRYLFAADLAFCREKDAALRMLKSAIEGKYCAYTALQKDPLLASLRGTPEFAQLLSTAKQCQDNFLAERAQLPH